MKEKIESLIATLEELPELLRISAINDVKKALHEISPFHDQPIDCVLWVPSRNIKPNDYNPNSVAPPEMRLLKHSIECDGYTQPIVTWDEGNGYKIVDGEHRYKVGTLYGRVMQKVKNHLPITIIRENRGGEPDRMASTIRHNRARGSHAVSNMTDIVSAMLQNGLDDESVSTELGMDADEFMRFKQNTGMPELFKNHEYSKSWEI